MPIELIGMIGVRPEGADGAAVHVIGGEIDPGWVRDFSRAHEARGLRPGADRLHLHRRRRASSWPYAAAHTERSAS